MGRLRTTLHLARNEFPFMMSGRQQSTIVTPNRHRSFYRQFVPPMLHCLVLALTTYSGLKLLKQKLRDEKILEEMNARRASLEEEVVSRMKGLEHQPPSPPLPWWRRSAW